MEENVLVFFWLLKFFYWNLSIFCRGLSKKKSGSFLNTAKYVCRTRFWYFFPKEKVFSILYFELQTFRLWEKLLRKNLQFSFFVCRWFLVLFSQRFRVFFGPWDQIFSASTETIQQCFRKSFHDVQKNILIVCFVQKNSSIFSDPEQIFLAVWIISSWHWTKKCRIRAQSNNLIQFSRGNVSPTNYSSGKLSDCEQNLSKKDPNFPFFLLEGHFGTFFPEI